MASIEGYAAQGVFAPAHHFQAVKVTDVDTLLFIAGQVARDPNGQCAHRGDFTGQARLVFQALEAQVQAGGGGVQNIVKINIYLTDIRHRADLALIREEFLGPKQPAVTLVAVTALAQPDWLIEVDAIAVL